MPTLNNSNISKQLHLFFLIICLSVSLYKASAEENLINVVTTPNPPKQGDVVVLKIEKDLEKKISPKVFFDRMKVPSFQISDNYFRTLIPLVANIKPGKHAIDVFYNGTTKRIDLNVQEKKYPLQELTLSKQVSALRVSKIENAALNKALGTVSDKKLWSGKFIFPSDGPESTAYGVKRRINGVISPDYFHKGLDFAAKEGSDIKAPENGKVILTGQNSKGFIVNGNCVFLDHGQGVISGYLHLSKILVKNGDLVKKGQVIGKVGSTGIASGPHLHWGIYITGKTVDPMCWTTTVID